MLWVEYQFEGLAALLKQVTAWKLPSYVYKLPKHSIHSCIKVNSFVTVKQEIHTFLPLVCSNSRTKKHKLIPLKLHNHLQTEFLVVKTSANSL